MKTQKMSLANIQGKLSRAEMKNIMAGSESGGTGCYKCCWNGTSNCSSCSFSYSGASCTTNATLVKCEGC
ncbi:MAG: hypothetical protein ABL929_08955 [Ferruginibacter sp.]|nr:hypothetical protein [Ferruginibacter sp.]